MLTSGAAAGVAAGPDRRDSGGEAAGLSRSHQQCRQMMSTSPLETKMTGFGAEAGGYSHSDSSTCGEGRHREGAPGTSTV